MARFPTCPPELTRRVFRGSDAVDAGLISREKLRHRMWARVGEDVYVLAAHRHDPWARLDALRLLTDGRHVACGMSAAWLHGVWSPPPGRPVPLEVSRPLATHGAAVQGHERRRLTLSASPSSGTGVSDVVTMHGITVTSPERTCFDLMRGRELVEAVVVADAFLAGGIVDPLVLAVYCQERARWPGVRGARAAVGLASPFSRSAGESRLRMTLVLAGFEVPLINVPVLDEAGRHVATPDLQVRGRRWAWLEYDGAYHETPDQHAADVRRENRLAVASSGVPVLRYDRRHVATSTTRMLLVDEVASATGTRPRIALRPADFVRPSTHAW